MKKLTSIMFTIFMVALAFIVNIPLLYALVISFMEPDQILSIEGNYLPFPPTIENYIGAFNQTTLGRFTINTMIIALVSSIVRVLTASLAAYAFAFFEFRGKNILFTFVLSTIMIPAEIVLISNYQIVSGMGLLNTYLGIMIVSLTSAANIFLLRQAFLSFNKSLREAAFIDGCSNFKFYWKVLLPCTKPTLITVFIQAFISSWNSYLWPMIITTENEMRTVQVGITMLNFSEATVYGPIMAASVLILLPTVVLLVLFQRKLVSGLMAGSVKE